MSEDWVPHNAGRDKANYQEIALILNPYLQPDLLLDVQYPVELSADFSDFNDAMKAEWYSFT